MPDIARTFADRIAKLLDSQGRTARAVSIEATGKPDTIRDALRRGSIPKEPALSRVAATLGTTTDYLLGMTDSDEPVFSEVGVSDRRLDWRAPQPDEPGIPLVGTGDCADLTVTTEDGSEVEIERTSFDPDYTVQVIARPPALRGNRDAYAIFFHGESMEPRFFAGEVGIADPRRPAAPGDFVVVQMNGREGHPGEVTSVLVKRLVRANSRELVLEQYNPPLVFSVPRARVVQLHRLIPPTEQLL